MIWPFKKNKGNWPPERSAAWPRYIKEYKAIVCWTNNDLSRRVFLIAKSNGTFSHDEEYFSDDPFEMCWLSMRSGVSIYDSEEIAIKEIYGTFPWIKDIEPKRNNAEQNRIR